MTETNTPHATRGQAYIQPKHATRIVLLPLSEASEILLSLRLQIRLLTR